MEVVNTIHSEVENYKKIDSWIEKSKNEIEEKFKNTKFQDVSKLILEFYDKVYPLLTYDNNLNNSFSKQINYSINDFLSKTPKIRPFIELLRNLKLNRYFSEVMFAYFKYRSLSSGEYHILDLLSLIYENREKSKLIILDEPDSTLHPHWQKKLLQTLLRVIPKIFPNKQIQLILTSHSPFLVSDLPKENVIFLRKGKEREKLENGKDAEGKCIVEKNSFKEQTFGQNIHTLFANSFFLENNGGLMGEFAKEKLLKVIGFINGTRNDIVNNDEVAQKYIDLIGEPILKRQLQKKLYEKQLEGKQQHEKINLLRKMLNDLEK